MSSLHRTTPSPPRPRSLVPLVAPVALAVGAYGVSYGVLAVAAGLSPAVATLSSLLVLAGGSQFAFVAVLAAGGNPWAGALGGLLLNGRYLAFSAAIAARLPAAPLGRRLLDGYLVFDESVSLALAGPRHDVVRRFRAFGVTLAATWVATTAIGAYAGRLLGDLDTWGLDAAFPASFLVLLAPWLRTRRGRVAAVTGVLLALALTPVAPPGVAVLAAGLGAVVALQVPESRAAPDGGGS